LMFTTAVVEEIGDELTRLIVDRGYTRLVLHFRNFGMLAASCWPTW
jgi:hypothetical protein